MKEQGDNNDEIKKNESKKWTIKIVMAYVMQNLKRLNGSEIEFGKLRVTDDYTLKERELIRSWVKKAEEKTTGDSEFHYRVRVIQKTGYILHIFPR